MESRKVNYHPPTPPSLPPDSLAHSPSIMARIDKEALEALESYFGGEGVTLKEFVSIMGETLRTSDEQEAVGALCGLFKEIDINGDAPNIQVRRMMDELIADEQAEMAGIRETA